MSDETCAFCLGGASEIPPFGSLKDAQDLIHPCSTCSLVTHRKCLVDWFNTIPFAQISRDYSDEDASDDIFANIDPTPTPIVPSDSHGAEEEEDADLEPNTIDVSLRSRWFTVLGQYSSTPGIPVRNEHPIHEEPLSNSGRVLLSTPCPQCKSKITFQIRRSGLLAVNSLIRNTISDTVQYSGILLGLSGAATGIVTMGYVGLARCGVSIVDAIVPISLISPLFKRTSTGSSQSLSASINSSEQNSYFLASQLKFQHIPLLPVMLYRMRYSSLLDCLFRTKPRASLTDWISELLVCNYISSLGNHSFVRQLYGNIKTVLGLSITRKKTLLQFGLLFKGIDWWDPAVMVGATIPARWLYDLVYRFTVNRIHFDLNTSMRPRDIANTLEPRELSTLENLETQLAGVKYNISQRLANARTSKMKSEHTHYFRLVREMVRLLRDGTISKSLHLRLLHFYYKSKACMKHDYSSTLLYRSAIVTAVTTFLWPFIAADLGKVIYGLCLSKIPSFAHVEREKMVFLSNLLGMAVAAFLKDIGNLFMCYQKARQLSELTVITQRENIPVQRQRRSDYTSRFPGAYEH